MSNHLSYTGLLLTSQIPKPHAAYKPEEPKRSDYDRSRPKSFNVIYLDVTSDDLDFDWEEYAKNNSIKSSRPAKSYNKLTLQDIVDLAPPGAKLSEIALHIDIGDTTEIKFIHEERDFEAEEAFCELPRPKGRGF